MIWIAPLVVVAIVFAYEFFSTHKRWLRAVIFSALSFILMGIVVAIDYNIQSTDTEVWSGYIGDWNHEEEWEEWVPPQKSCTTDSNGKQSCTTTPGYWQHHYAINEIKTTDAGWVSVDRTPKGKVMDDSYPNTTKELKSYFPEGTATASRHSYVNKVQSSYSIYRHEDIDENDYPDLPDYPDTVKDYFYIDRILGKVPKKKEALLTLNQLNTELNKMIPDPENKGKKMSYKQVNIIFVNVGEGKDIDYAYALQNKWEGGNKNDFVIAFSMDKSNNITWAYPFTWSEVELLKLEVEDYMESQKKVEDFVPIVEEVGKLVEEKFVRKQFAEFEYLQLETSKGAHILIWVLSMVMVGLHILLPSDSISPHRRNGYRHYR